VTEAPTPVLDVPTARVRTAVERHSAGERADATAPPGDGSGPVASGYRPHLDGLRAVAVYLVVAFHAGSTQFSGGFIGVDVFFVMSGYLVTQLLWRDLAQLGRIRLTRFYARRVRRLLPAAAVTLVTTAIVFSALGSPSDIVAARNGFTAAFAYCANWFFVHRSTAYFGGDIEANPVLHFWSLAVEEQFYLVWPLALGGLFALARRFGPQRLRVVRGAIVVAALASFVWAMALRTSDPTRAYYGTDTRAYQLLVGALIALCPTLLAAARFRAAVRVLAPLALLATIGLALDVVDFDAIIRGGLVTTATAILIAALEHSDSVARRVLSNGALTYLGRISYGTYLWHWLVILVINSTMTMSVGSRLAVTALVATALASLSFHVLEAPIRTSPRLDRVRLPVIAAGLALSLAGGFIAIPALLDSDGAPAAVVNPGTAGTPIPPDLDFSAAAYTDLPPLPDCVDTAPSACIVVRGSGRHLLLMGDSHARMYLPAFIDIARDRDLTLSVVGVGGCPWARGLYSAMSPDDCARVKTDGYDRVIPALDPDVIVVVQYGFEDPIALSVVPLLDADGTPILGPDATARANIRAVDASLAALLGTDRDLVIIEPTPVARASDPARCLRTAEYLEQCRYTVGIKPSALEQHYRRIDRERNDVWSANFDRLVCPWLPICDPVVAGHLVKIDGHHISLAHSRSIAPAIADYLAAASLL
jgi:peptidoglycan/LPS O-acetylase OafA/YrhL